MTISAKVIEDSLSIGGSRLTTMVLTYPRFIHSEFMTHRVFSRNASSSRAIPVAKQIKAVQDNPAMPVSWGVNKPGMQATERMSERGEATAKAAWLAARDDAVMWAKVLTEGDEPAHKQIANRIIEPFTHITVIVTATDYQNFFNQRRHDAADPTIHALADAMYHALSKSTPHPCQHGGWHLPFIDDGARTAAINHAYELNQTLNRQVTVDQINDEAFAIMLQMSVARCARVSYMNHDGTPSTVPEDLKLYGRLVDAEPAHASPTEHQAKAVPPPTRDLRSNLQEWTQFRKVLGL